MFTLFLSMIRYNNADNEHFLQIRMDHLYPWILPTFKITS